MSGLKIDTGVYWNAFMIRLHDEEQLFALVAYGHHMYLADVTQLIYSQCNI